MVQEALDVVVVGNAGIDTNVYLRGQDVDFNVEANFTDNFDYVGQAGGYCSRGYAQLGKKTAFIGSVGDDHNGHFVQETLADDGIDLSGLFIDPTGTGRSVNIMYRDGRRKNFYDGKGHMTLRPDLDLCRVIMRRAKFAHFSIPNWARKLLPIARDLGLPIACDIQDVISIDDPYRREFIEHADYLFFSDANLSEPNRLIQRFLDINPEQIIIVGLGSKGCALATRDGIQTFPAIEMEEPVIDTNGSGDALAVGFLAARLLDGRSLTEAVTCGQIAARYTCTLRASSSNLITPKKLTDFLTARSQSMRSRAIGH